MCLFCKIISGEISSYKVYEDENVFAFLDIADDYAGHTVVASKKHIENMYECGPRVFQKFMASVKKLADHYIDDCGFDGYNIISNCKECSGQSVMHMHFHILPRRKDDNYKVFVENKSIGSDFESLRQKLFLENEDTTTLDYKKYAEECKVLYTDGACSGNPGIGGYGGVLIAPSGEAIEYSGGEDGTTNNKMELTAVIEGLKRTDEGDKVRIYSDSAYVVNAYQQNWIEGWKRRDWIGSTGLEVANIELWQELDELVSSRHVEFVKVKGHSDNVVNNRCDELATDYYKKKA